MAKQSLTDQKSQKELELLREKVKSERINRWISIGKGIAVALGSAFIFLLIQRPESILNRKSSEESINRERAKLIIDVLKEKDPEARAKSIQVIKETYPNLNDVIDSIENSIESNANIQILSDLEFKLTELGIKRSTLKKALENSQSDVEKRILRTNLELVELQIKDIQNQINNLKTAL